MLTVVSDDDDNRVLEAAIEGAADYIVSGDADLLDLGSFQGIPIIRPAEFAATVLGGAPASCRECVLWRRDGPLSALGDQRGEVGADDHDRLLAQRRDDGLSSAQRRPEA